MGPEAPEFAPTQKPSSPPPRDKNAGLPSNSFFEVKPTESKSEILDDDGSGPLAGGLSFNLAFPPR